uniref:Uncharacterized protein n=1 Tax=Lepeophtheirus salmonis TaxID=72036 RepID=A0A0K2TXJ5_LEPSM
MTLERDRRFSISALHAIGCLHDHRLHHPKVQILERRKDYVKKGKLDSEDLKNQCRPIPSSPYLPMRFVFIIQTSRSSFCNCSPHLQPSCLVPLLFLLIECQGKGLECPSSKIPGPLKPLSASTGTP